MRIKFPLLKADVPAPSGNIYPKELLEKIVKDFEPGKPILGIMWGETEVRLSEAKISTDKLWIEGDILWGEGELLDESLRGMLMHEKLRVAPGGEGRLTGNKVNNDYILDRVIIAPPLDNFHYPL